MPRRELLIGCGSKRIKEMYQPAHKEWEGLVTLDFAATHKPDIVWDLTKYPWGGTIFPDATDGDEWVHTYQMLPALADSSFDEVHAYEVLEHLGQQGDFVSFFQTFSEIYRLLKPDGLLFAHSPSLTSRWLWGDPGHTRAITPESLVFLDQSEYTKQIGVTPMSDYRQWFRGDFKLVHQNDNGESFRFVLKAIKPSRISN